jgi:hypothetical protein
LVEIQNAGITIKHSYDKCVMRRFKIESLDIPNFTYDDYLSSIKNTYVCKINKDDYYSVTHITDHIIQKSDGRILLPFNLIDSVELLDDTTVEITYSYGFIETF